MTEVQPDFTPRPVTQSKAVQVAATVISYICHPVLMPTVMAIVLYYLSPADFIGITDHEFGKWLIIIILNTLLFPLLAVLLLRGLGFIKSILMHDPKDRIIPLIGAMIFYFWANNVFKNITSPFILKVLLLGSFWGIIAIFMINIFYKVSMHTAAAGSMLGIIIVLMLMSPVNMVLPFFVALVVAGIIGTARLVLGAHRSGQVWLGYVIGILVQVGAFFYLYTPNK